VATGILFNKYDVFGVLEDKKKRLRAEYRRLPDEQALDEGTIQSMKSEYLLQVPVLRAEEMSYEEGKTQIDARRLPNRVFFGGSGPVLEDALLLTIHIPFDGDPGVFNIAPSAFNSRVAEGEIVGQDLVLRITVVDGNYDVQGHIDREIQQIKWALTHLREKEGYFLQELGGVLAQEVQQRRRAVESRADVTGQLKIPRRSPSSLSAVPPQSLQPPRPQRAMAVANTATAGTQIWDVFISHASEDKPYVDPLVMKLGQAGISVWYNRLVLEWGDDLRSRIDGGLINCRYGIVVLSKAFLRKKKWTEHELNSLFARERVGQKLILPIWHDITREDLLTYSPSLADRMAKIANTDSYEDIVATLNRLLGKVPNTILPAKPYLPARGVTVAHAHYDGPDAARIHLLVCQSATDDKLFVFEDAAGNHRQGSVQEIAIEYVLADRKLTTNGFKRMSASGGGTYPEFNI
jgi:hypothetical protein